MVLEITNQGLIAFGFTMALFVLFSYYDIKTRKVPNRLVLGGLILGVSASLLTGHLLDQLYLHLAGIVIGLVIVLLFYKGAIGGGDLKVILLVQCVSPGFEFGYYGDFIFEAVLGVLTPLVVMFALGIVYSERKRDSNPTPLIPFLFGGYLLMQLIVLL